MDRSRWVPVSGSGGWRGAMEPDPVPYAGEPHVVLHLEGGERVMVPASMLTRRGDGTPFLPLTRAQLDQGSRPSTGESGAADELVVPVVEERLEVGKRQWETGGVRVHVGVRQREEVVDEPLVREEVHVERVPINRPVDGVPGVRQEGGVTIVPVVEEVLVVQKRLMLKEEVRITKRRFEAHEPQKVVLRTEEPQIEEIEPESKPGRREAA
jgi:uncharacterized protein (TIGR02271 family)